MFLINLPNNAKQYGVLMRYAMHTNLLLDVKIALFDLCPNKNYD